MFFNATLPGIIIFDFPAIAATEKFCAGDVVLISEKFDEAKEAVTTNGTIASKTASINADNTHFPPSLNTPQLNYTILTNYSPAHSSAELLNQDNNEPQPDTTPPPFTNNYTQQT